MGICHHAVLFIGFAVKLPVFPLHGWLPDAHAQAPTAGSVDLAGILIKTAAFGLLRFVLPLFPTASAEFAPVAIVLGVIGIFMGHFWHLPKLTSSACLPIPVSHTWALSCLPFMLAISSRYRA